MELGRSLSEGRIQIIANKSHFCDVFCMYVLTFSIFGLTKPCLFRFLYSIENVETTNTPTAPLIIRTALDRQRLLIAA